MRINFTMTEYKTVLGEGSDSFTEKKSKFIAHCSRALSEDEALTFIKKIKAKHSDANHNVWAYILKNGGIIRYSDDGEPQGTAGIPVIDVLKKTALLDTVLVVTRYFGGTLLGAGGLVRAYSHGASIAIAAAQPVLMRECFRLRLRCEYSRYTKAEEIIVQFDGVIDDTAFDDAVTIDLHMLPEKIDEFKLEIADLTSGRAEIKKIDEDFYEFSIN